MLNISENFWFLKKINKIIQVLQVLYKNHFRLITTFLWQFRVFFSKILRLRIFWRWVCICALCYGDVICFVNLIIAFTCFNSWVLLYHLVKGCVLNCDEEEWNSLNTILIQCFFYCSFNANKAGLFEGSFFCAESVGLLLRFQEELI